MSQGWHTDVKPPGIAMTRVPNSPMVSIKSGYTWDSNRSRISVHLIMPSTYGFHTFSFHNCITRLPIQCFACEQPHIPPGIIWCKLFAILRFYAPLKIKKRGRLVLSAATEMHTVHRFLSSLPCRTDTEFAPLFVNSVIVVRVELDSSFIHFHKHAAGIRFIWTFVIADWVNSVRAASACWVLYFDTRVADGTTNNDGFRNFRAQLTSF